MGDMRRKEACLYVAPSDRTVQERLVANGKTPQKLAVRARIVLLSGRGSGTGHRGGSAGFKAYRLALAGSLSGRRR
jgi:hypothetical protein